MTFHMEVYIRYVFARGQLFQTFRYVFARGQSWMEEPSEVQTSLNSKISLKYFSHVFNFF
jgi:hypothetical protein